MDRTLHEFPIIELPRERLDKYGAESLSNSELLALLLRSGGPNINALQLSQMLLAEFDGLKSLLNADIDRLKSIKYLGMAKASCIKATGELARRSLIVEDVQKPKVETPQEVFNLVLPYILGKGKECLYLLNLDFNNRLIKLSLLSIGTLNQTLADTREILRTSLLKNAVSIILVHNHPSENLDPSTDDIQLTKELAIASTYVGINFLDHIIVTSTDYYSFKLSGLINFSSRKGVKK